MRDQLLSYALKYNGDYNKIKLAIHQNKSWSISKYHGKYVTILDENYPLVLFRLCNPPYVLFYSGNLDLIHMKCIAIIGSRTPHEYGIKMCEIICNYLKSDYCIVSGLAKGIDGIAHLNALSHNTIGVIGCGLDVVYPKENKYLYENMKKNHLIISEYPLGVPPIARHFPMRNRIIAALSSNVIVCEAKKRSGTLLTVNEAIQIGVNVHCVPHLMNDIDGAGCNLLIQEGANILTGIQDLAELK